MAKFQLYRKALVAFMVAALGLLATFIPGIDSILSPVEIQVAAGVLAAIAVAVTSDRLDGASVVELARLVVDALDSARPDPDDPKGGEAGVAAKSIMRAGDPLPLMITATPMGGDRISALASAEFGPIPVVPAAGGAA